MSKRVRSALCSWTFALLFLLCSDAGADESMMAAPVERESRAVEITEPAPVGDSVAPANQSVKDVPPNRTKTKRMVRRIYIRRRFYTTPSIGISSIQYKETGVSNYSAISVTGKLSTRYPLTPRWDFGGSVYFTAMPITQNPNTNTARFLGMNARIGYAPRGIRAPYRLSILTGLYYTRMFVSNNAFGFKDMVGPQLFPVLHRSFKNGDSGMIYGKYSPVTNNLSVLSLSNREVAAGITYAYTMRNKKVLTFSLDLALMNLEIDSTATAAGLVTTSTISTSSVTVGVGMNL